MICDIIRITRTPRSLNPNPLVWGANLERTDKMFTPTTRNTIKYTYSFNAETAKAQSNMNSKLLATVHRELIIAMSQEVA